MKAMKCTMWFQKIGIRKMIADTNFGQSKVEKVYNDVYEVTYEISDLIDPSEVTDEAETWSDVDPDDLDQEISECITVKNEERGMNGMLNELATIFYMESLPRVSLDDLIYDTEEEALKNGYWPNSMTNYEAESILTELRWNDEFEIPQDAVMKASWVIDSAYSDRLDPRRSRGDSL